MTFSCSDFFLFTFFLIIITFFFLNTYMEIIAVINLLREKRVTKKEHDIPTPSLVNKYMEIIALINLLREKKLAPPPKKNDIPAPSLVNTYIYIWKLLL